MPSYSLIDYATQVLSLGRAAIFYADYWDDATDLALTHIGITEEPITPPSEEEFSRLTLGEHTGAVGLEAHAAGPSGPPMIEFNVVDGTQAAFDLFSPTGNASAGYRRRRPVTERTLVLFPEALLIEADQEVALAYTTAAGWTVGGDAASADQLALIDLSIWYWRGFFHRSMPVMSHEDGGKIVFPVAFEILQDQGKPDGEQLWTFGDPADANIDISPVGG